MRKLRTKPNNELRIKTTTLIDGQKVGHKIENYLFFISFCCGQFLIWFFLFYMVFIIIFLMVISFLQLKSGQLHCMFYSSKLQKLVCKFWLFNLNTKKKLTNKIWISLPSSAELYLIDIRNRIFVAATPPTWNKNFIYFFRINSCLSKCDWNTQRSVFRFFSFILLLLLLSTNEYYLNVIFYYYFYNVYFFYKIVFKTNKK